MAGIHFRLLLSFGLISSKFAFDFDRRAEVTGWTMKSDRIYKIDKITSGADMEGMWLAFKLI